VVACCCCCCPNVVQQNHQPRSPGTMSFVQHGLHLLSRFKRERKHTKSSICVTAKGHNGLRQCHKLRQNMRLLMLSSLWSQIKLTDGSRKNAGSGCSRLCLEQHGHTCQAVTTTAGGWDKTRHLMCCAAAPHQQLQLRPFSWGGWELEWSRLRRHKEGEDGAERGGG
jgi:hypothetical protein